MLIRPILVTCLFLTSPVFASGLSGFDGLDWGSSRNDIIEVKGNPTYNWGTSAVWTVAGSETVGGYAIDNVYFQFKEGCSELKETISEPCFMWGGSYVFVDGSLSMFEELTPKIASRYGQYYEEKETDPQEDYSTKQFLGNHVTTTRIFDLDDGSRVSIYVKERDRTWSQYGDAKSKGVFALGLSYESSELVESKNKAKANKSKDF